VLPFAALTSGREVLSARNDFPVHWAGVSVPAGVTDEVRLALLPNVPFPRLFGEPLLSSLLAARVLGGGFLRLAAKGP
jgi:hypothetical protein